MREAVHPSNQRPPLCISTVTKTHKLRRWVNASSATNVCNSVAEIMFLPGVINLKTTKALGLNVPNNANRARGPRMSASGP
jgi:hypothetical protein